MRQCNYLLKLVFEGTSSPQLIASEFANSSLMASFRCIRGNTPAAPSTGTFPYSSGVAGLALLTVKSCLAAHGSSLDKTSAFLEGGKATLAASLDHSLSKKPAWLMDMFGTDAAGRPVAARLFRRINPERKRSGPVRIMFNPSFLSDCAFQIEIDGVVVTRPALLRQLAHQIESHWDGQARSSPVVLTRKSIAPHPCLDGIPTPTENKSASHRPQRSLASFVRDEFVREAGASLFNTRIFEERWVNETTGRLQHNSLVKTIAGKDVAKLNSLTQRRLDGGMRLGTCESVQRLCDTLTRNRPMRVALSCTLVGAISLFDHLADSHSFPFEIKADFLLASDPQRAVESSEGTNRPDLIVSTIMGAAYLLRAYKRLGYEPFILGPGSTHHLLGAPGNRLSGQLQRADLYFSNPRPGTGLFYFEELKKAGCISKKHVSLHHMESDEIVLSMRQPHPRECAVLWFPHHVFHRCLNGFVFEDLNTADTYSPTVLFAHSSLAKQKELLAHVELAIRYAWMDLLEQPRLLEELVDRRLHCKSYKQLIGRACGLNRLSDPSMPYEVSEWLDTNPPGLRRSSERAMF